MSPFSAAGYRPVITLIFVVAAPLGASMLAHSQPAPAPTARPDPADLSEGVCKRAGDTICEGKLTAYKTALAAYENSKYAYQLELQNNFDNRMTRAEFVSAVQNEKAALEAIDKVQSDYQSSGSPNPLETLVAKLVSAQAARTKYIADLAAAQRFTGEPRLQAIRSARQPYLDSLQATVDASLALGAARQPLDALVPAVQQLLADVQRHIPAALVSLPPLSDYAASVTGSSIKAARDAMDAASITLAKAAIEAEQAGVVFKKPDPPAGGPSTPRLGSVRIKSARYGGTAETCDITGHIRLACEFQSFATELCVKDGKVETKDCKAADAYYTQTKQFFQADLAACQSDVKADFCPSPRIREQFSRRATVHYFCTGKPDETRTISALDGDLLLITCTQ